MLKIKDNVDLKELEKYGFGDREKINSMEKFYSTRLNIQCEICVGKFDRMIWTSGTLDKELDPLYDLIKDGLVEKVEDGKNE